LKMKRKMFIDNYLFFGRCYQIESDDKKLQETLRNVYRHLRVPGVKRDARKIFISRSNKKDKEVVVMMDDQQYNLYNPDC